MYMGVERTKGIKHHSDSAAARAQGSAKGLQMFKMDNDIRKNKFKISLCPYRERMDPAYSGRNLKISSSWPRSSATSSSPD
jgi:hypothetical protein